MKRVVIWPRATGKTAAVAQHLLQRIKANMSTVNATPAMDPALSLLSTFASSGSAASGGYLEAGRWRDRVEEAWGIPRSLVEPEDLVVQGESSDGHVTHTTYGAPAAGATTVTVSTSSALLAAYTPGGAAVVEQRVREEAARHLAAELDRRIAADIERVVNLAAPATPPAIISNRGDVFNQQLLASIRNATSQDMNEASAALAEYTRAQLRRQPLLGPGRVFRSEIGVSVGNPNAVERVAVAPVEPTVPVPASLPSTPRRPSRTVRGSRLPEPDCAGWTDADLDAWYAKEGGR